MDDRQGDALDEATLARLGEALQRVEPMPPSVRQAALGAFVWRTVDAELAQLTYDSGLDARVPEGVRGDVGPRMMTFTGGEVAIEVEVSGEGRLRRLVGQLVPPADMAVEVHHAGAVASTRTDGLGRFLVEGVRAGPVRISCLPQPGGRRVDTDWITL